MSIVGETLMPRLNVIAQPAAFLLFPVLFMVLTTPPFHPSLAGTVEEEIRGLADAATRWRLVHLGLTIGSILGGLTVVSLGRVVGGRLWSVAGRAASAVGVVSALVLVGVFLQEAIMVPSLAKACARVETCLAPENRLFFQEFARLGWQEVPYLGWGGIGLTGSLLVVGLLGWRAGNLRFWEALPLVLGCARIILTEPSLHGNAIFGFIGILVGLGFYAVRMVRPLSGPIR